VSEYVQNMERGVHLGNSGRDWEILSRQILRKCFGVDSYGSG
jgi:hypothetical protein